MRHLGELVEKERPAIRSLEEPRLVAIGAGERALAMPEHLALEQRFRKRGAVDRHELAARATTVTMDELRNHFLPRSALAGDHHRGVGGRDLSRELHRLAKGGGDAEESDLVAVAALLDELLTERLRLARDHHGVRRAADQHLQMRRGERLREIVPRAGTKRLDARRNARIPRHDDDDGLAVRFERRLEDVYSRDRLEIEVHQHDVELPAAHDLERLVSAPNEGDVVAVQLEDARASLAKSAIVIHHENANVGLHRRGNGERVAANARRWRRHIHWWGG